MNRVGQRGAVRTEVVKVQMVLFLVSRQKKHERKDEKSVVAVVVGEWVVYSSSFVMKRFPSQDCVYLRVCCGRRFPYVQRASNLVSTGGRGLKTGCCCCCCCWG